MANRTKVIAGKDGGETVELTDEENAEIDAREQEWANGQISRDALVAIADLEAEITPRRMREALLSEEGKTWLTNKESEIATERAKL